MKYSIAAVSLAAVLAGAPVFAQDASDEFAEGRAEYLAACAACHGEEADGNGPIATMFTTRVPNLRQITKNNDGVFPTLEVFQVIDGRTVIRAHGNPMPLFGSRYKADVGAEAGPYGAERLARARLLELVLYLQSIQE